MKKLWGGRFEAGADKDLQNFWNSISFDWKLAAFDIEGSIAHAAMLGKCGIISAEESQQLVTGLKEIADDLQAGKLEFSQEDEDIHMNIERILSQRIGAVAGKLHTGRSRNDQVALDMHLYVRTQCLETVRLLCNLQAALFEQAELNKAQIMSGYTHLQRAQPVLFSHHLLAYVAMLDRDVSRMMDCYKRANVCPLGAGALAGTTFPIDRKFVADYLKFDGLYENSMDAVSDRDFSIEFLSTNSLIMMHLSRFCEEVVLWNSSEFGFITLDDRFSTGSSMMPQKKNPDLAELVRGKTGRVYGSLMALLTTLKGLPLTYNKDMQEDKEGVFDTVTTVQGALTHLSGMVASWKVNGERMYEAASTNFTNATDIADYLAKKGLPFRQAHEIVGNMVRECIEKHYELQMLSLGDFKLHSPLFEQDVFEALKVENIVARRTVRGGTAPSSVSEQLVAARKKIDDALKWVSERSYERR